MRVLLVGAGAGFSTKDVETGYLEAFQELNRQGKSIDIGLFLLDYRIKAEADWQKFWWKRAMRGDPLRRPGWEDAVYGAGTRALEMALRFDADWVFTISAMYFHPDAILMMRRAGLKVAVLFTESPYEDEGQARIAPLVDICFTNERTSVEFLAQYNPNTYYLRHAYSPMRHDEVSRGSAAPVKNAVASTVARHPCPVQGRSNSFNGVCCHDVVFVGTGFWERIQLLGAIDWDGLGINLGLYGPWNLLSSRHRLRKYLVGGVVSNETALDIYSRSKIGLNLYRTSKRYRKGIEAGKVDNAESLNPRAYELAACKTFCLTDYRREQIETFGLCQPTFTDAEDLQRKILFFLGNREMRQKFIDLAWEKVQGHTFESRAVEVLAHFSAYDRSRSLNVG